MEAQLIQETRISASEQQALRNKLDTFYQNTTDYTAFETVSSQTLCWEKIENEIRRQANTSGRPIHVLEIGAGRSGFGQYLINQGIRPQVHYTAQDVTSQNAVWLESQADKVIYGDVSFTITDTLYDIIFSTYVLEHVSDPTAHLEHLYQLLNPAGSLFIFCPRYDIPGYFCPSSRHLNLVTRLKFGIQWGLARLGSLVSRRPAFLIQTDLSAFHKPFFIDADAVHWVSVLDLKLWSKSKRAFIKSFSFGSPVFGTKDWVVKRFLTCAVQIQKAGT